MSTHETPSTSRNTSDAVDDISIPEEVLQLWSNLTPGIRMALVAKETTARNLTVTPSSAGAGGLSRQLPRIQNSPSAFPATAPDIMSDTAFLSPAAAAVALQPRVAMTNMDSASTLTNSDELSGLDDILGEAEGIVEDAMHNKHVNTGDEARLPVQEHQGITGDSIANLQPLHNYTRKYGEGARPLSWVTHAKRYRHWNDNGFYIGKKLVWYQGRPVWVVAIGICDGNQKAGVDERIAGLHQKQVGWWDIMVVKVTGFIFKDFETMVKFFSRGYLPDESTGGEIFVFVDQTSADAYAQDILSWASDYWNDVAVTLPDCALRPTGTTLRSLEDVKGHTDYLSWFHGIHATEKFVAARNLDRAEGKIVKSIHHMSYDQRIQAALAYYANNRWPGSRADRYQAPLGEWCIEERKLRLKDESTLSEDEKARVKKMKDACIPPPLVRKRKAEDTDDEVPEADEVPECMCWLTCKTKRGKAPKASISCPLHGEVVCLPDPEQRSPSGMSPRGPPPADARNRDGSSSNFPPRAQLPHFGNSNSAGPQYNDYDRRAPAKLQQLQPPPGSSDGAPANDGSHGENNNELASPSGVSNNFLDDTRSPEGSRNLERFEERVPSVEGGEQQLQQQQQDQHPSPPSPTYQDALKMETPQGPPGPPHVLPPVEVTSSPTNAPPNPHMPPYGMPPPGMPMHHYPGPHHHPAYPPPSPHHHPYPHHTSMFSPHHGPPPPGHVGHPGMPPQFHPQHHHPHHPHHQAMSPMHAPGTPMHGHGPPPMTQGQVGPNGEMVWPCNYCHIKFTNWEDCSAHEGTCPAAAYHHPGSAHHHPRLPPGTPISSTSPGRGRKLKGRKMALSSFPNNGHLLMDENAEYAQNTDRDTYLLSTANDSESLSDRQCYVRSHFVELFIATQQDVSSRHSRGAQKLSINQIGLRCAYCAKLKPRDRAERAICYPSSISRICQTVADMQRFHFESCVAIPPKVLHTYKSLKTRRPRGQGSPQSYWDKSARDIGLVDTPQGIQVANAEEDGGLGGEKLMAQKKSVVTGMLESLSGPPLPPPPANGPPPMHVKEEPVHHHHPPPSYHMMHVPPPTIHGGPHDPSAPVIPASSAAALVHAAVVSSSGSDNASKEEDHGVGSSSMDNTTMSINKETQSTSNEDANILLMLKKTPESPPQIDETTKE